MDVLGQAFIKKNRWKSTRIALALFLLFMYGIPSISLAEERIDSYEAASEGESRDNESGVATVEDRLNDLGEDNYVNIQQTPDNSFLYDISIWDLCNADSSYQKTMVQTKGEVVGDPIKAEQNPGKYWITLDAIQGEKEGSLSVLVDQTALNAIDAYGSYSKRGTIIRVKGVFHIACTSHEGIVDIHADTVTALEAGYSKQEELNIDKLYPGLFMCALGAILALGYRMLAEGER